MERIKNLSGLFWASDILTGQRPFYSPKKESEEPNQDFKSILDKEMSNYERKEKVE